MSDIEARLDTIEERLQYVERATGDIRTSAAASDTLVKVIHEDLKSIKNEMVAISKALNASKGAIGMLLGIAATAGASLALLVKKILGWT